MTRPSIVPECHEWILYWLGLFGLALLLAGVFAILSGFIPVASAEESNITIGEEIPYNITVPTPIPTNVEVGRRITQGDCVAIGETVDIAGIGWNTGKINYYGKYYDGFSGDNTSWEAEYSLDFRNLKNFFIDPVFFNQHPGWWYMGYETQDAAGNDRLFWVNATCPNQVHIVNHTVIYQPQTPSIAVNETQLLAMKAANLSQLPVKTEQNVDLIISKNISTTFDAPNNSVSAWIFGTDSPDNLYNFTLPFNQITFQREDNINLKPGKYDVLFIAPGKNGVLEELYDNATKAITSPFRSQQDTDVRDKDPLTTESFLKAKLASSYDDSYKVWKIDLQEPDIQIMKLSQDALTNNHSLIVLAGYTNVNQGETLSVQFDAENPNLFMNHTWTAQVMNNGGQVAYRTWNTSFIIDFNSVAPGQHYFTVTSPEGGSATVPIYRRNELAPHYQPQEEFGFFDNSPFIPTPTPIIIEKPVPGPTQIVIQTVEVTPAPEALQKAREAADWSVALNVVISVGLIFMIVWFYTAYRRAKKP